MSFSANEYPVLVAPRPVRLASGQYTTYNRPHHERARIVDTSSIDDFKVALFSDSPPDKDLSSPRSSPRSALPSEALEEFLSILRPSFFPPTSPVLRTRRQGVSLPTLHRERSFYRNRGRLEVLPKKSDDREELDISRSTQPSRNAYSSTPDTFNDVDGLAETDNDSPPVRWFKANVLSSPISRTHTRNPFLRHPSNQSPRNISPLSPAAIPLPLPTPDEMIEVL
ncbi:hypothetical protein L208DRAFT_1424918 [Tricholoma matsutake]|nr:hypothetical protein L208DRAFT_1424918 [Tricholoma matsutake 945]